MGLRRTTREVRREAKRKQKKGKIRLAGSASGLFLDFLVFLFSVQGLAAELVGTGVTDGLRGWLAADHAHRLLRLSHGTSFSPSHSKYRLPQTSRGIRMRAAGEDYLLLAGFGRQDFIAEDDWRGLAERGGDRAILVLAQLDGTAHRFVVEMPAERVSNLQLDPHPRRFSG